MEDYKSVSTLVECGIKLPKKNEEENVNPTYFESLVESLYKVSNMHKTIYSFLTSLTYLNC